MKDNKLIVFQDKTIRRTLVNDEWFFSVVDVVAALTDSPNPGAYWRKLKQRLTSEGSQVVTFCHELKLPAADGKKYKTDCANVKGMFRISHNLLSMLQLLKMHTTDCKLHSADFPEELVIGNGILILT